MLRVDVAEEGVDEQVPHSVEDVTTLVPERQAQVGRDGGVVYPKQGCPGRAEGDQALCHKKLVEGRASRGADAAAVLGVVVHERAVLKGLRTLGAGLAEDGWNESDTRALRRLIPYQNLTFIRQAFDRIEEEVGDL